MNAGRKSGSTRATPAKLERALIELESFLEASDVMSVIDVADRQALHLAVRTIQTIESRLRQRSAG